MSNELARRFSYSHLLNIMALGALEAWRITFTEKPLIDDTFSFLDISSMCTDRPYYLNAANPESTSGEITTHPAHPKLALRTDCFLESNYVRLSNGVPSRRPVRSKRLTEPMAPNESPNCPERASNWRNSSRERVHEYTSGLCLRHWSSQLIQRPHGSTQSASSAKRWWKIEAIDQLANEMPI